MMANNTATLPAVNFEETFVMKFDYVTYFKM